MTKTKSIDQLLDAAVTGTEKITGGSRCVVNSKIPVHDSDVEQKKGNNGFGNGADADRAAPGNSGSTGGGKLDSRGDDRGPR